MKLTNVQSPAASVPSPASTSTEQGATGASPSSTAPTPTSRVRFGSGARQQVVDRTDEPEVGTTSEQPHSRSLAFFTPPDLNSGEKTELRVIGAALAILPNSTIYTNDVNVEAGLAEEGGVVSQPLENSEDYDVIITYRLAPKRRERGSDAHISSYPNLKTFSKVAMEHIYAEKAKAMKMAT